MKSRTGSISHDHIFPALHANRVRYPRRNDNASVVVTAMIVTVNKEAHYAPRQACPDVAQNHLNPALQKEHDIPLLIIVTTPRIFFRFIDEQAAQPIRCGGPSWNAGRMHVETFCRVPKHSRSRPLLRPKRNRCQDSFVAPHKFAKESSMRLRVNLSRENFHARNPCVLDLALIPIRRQQLASLDTALS